MTTTEPRNYDMFERLLEAEKRGRLNYTVYVNPDAEHVLKATEDLKAGLDLNDAIKVGKAFRRGWDREQERLRVDSMHSAHPELRQLLLTRDSLQAIVQGLTNTIERIEKSYQ